MCFGGHNALWILKSAAVPLVNDGELISKKTSLLMSPAVDIAYLRIVNIAASYENIIILKWFNRLTNIQL